MCDFRLCNRHIGIIDDDRRDQVVFRSTSIFNESHGSASFNSKGLQNSSEKSGLGGNFTPYEGEIATQTFLFQTAYNR